MSSTTKPLYNNSKYCKVCHDAGKSIHEYTSHYVKDIPGPDGKIVCPLLLSQECLICHQLGHTTKYCNLKQNYLNKNDGFTTVIYGKNKEKIAEKVYKIAQLEKQYNRDQLKNEEYNENKNESIQDQSHISSRWVSIAAKPPIISKIINNESNKIILEKKCNECNECKEKREIYEKNTRFPQANEPFKMHPRKSYIIKTSSAWSYDSTVNVPG